MEPISGLQDLIGDGVKGLWGILMSILGFLWWKNQQTIDKHSDRLDELEKQKAGIAEVSYLRDKLDLIDEKMDRKHDDIRNILLEIRSER
jgi:hypothetical protein